MARRKGGRRRATSRAPDHVTKLRPTVGRGRGWSAADDAKLLRAVADNAEAAEWGRGRGALTRLAERLGRSPASVRSRLRRLRARGKAPGGA